MGGNLMGLQELERLIEIQRIRTTEQINKLEENVRKLHYLLEVRKTLEKFNRFSKDSEMFIFDD